MKHLGLILTVLCCAVLCASPYGRALKQARRVAGQQQIKGDSFDQILRKVSSILKTAKGSLPAPAGIAGLNKLARSGKFSVDPLKKDASAKLSESNCAWAYTGSALGRIKSLPKGGMFPVIFTKPAPGVKAIKVLFADGSSTDLAASGIRSCSDVVKTLQKKSRQGKNKVWTKILRATSTIDRSR